MQCAMDGQQPQKKHYLFAKSGVGKCKKDLFLFPKLRKDKYSSKRDKYFVDFKDLENRRESNEEMEEHTERTKAPISSSFSSFNII